MKTIIRVVLMMLVISSFAFGKAEKMNELKRYLGVSKDVVVKDFGKIDLVEDFGKEGHAIVYIKDDYNFETFHFDSKGICERHFAYYGVEGLEAKKKELEKAYGKPVKDEDGRFIYSGKIRLSELDPKNEDNKNEVINGKAMSFRVMEFMK